MSSDAESAYQRLKKLAAGSTDGFKTEEVEPLSNDGEFGFTIRTWKTSDVKLSGSSFVEPGSLDDSKPRIKEDFFAWENMIYCDGFDNNVYIGETDDLEEAEIIYQVIGDQRRAGIVREILGLVEKLKAGDLEAEARYGQLQREFTSIPSETEQRLSDYADGKSVP